MAIEFENPLTAGTVLVRSDIRSQNFVAGASGWRIEADGSAEFSDIIVRGTGMGDTVIIGPAGKPQVQIGSTASAGYIQFPTNRSIENDIATILSAVGNSGAANEYATLQLLGPSVDGATDRAAILISSQNNDGSSQANINMTAGSASIIYDETTFHILNMSSASSALRVNPASGHTGPLQRIQRDNTDRLVITNDGRAVLTPESSASSALFVNVASGYSGNLLRLQVNGTDQFVVDKDGVLTTYAANAFNSWTPTITGGGAATLSTADGWWQRRGNLIDVYAYFVIGVAGSGATVVQVSLPFTPWRGSANRRQNLPGAVRDGGYANPGPVAGLIFAGGAGATVNRLVDAAGTDVTGAALTAGSIWVFEGTLREA